MDINYEINRLIQFGLAHHMIEEADVLYAANTNQLKVRTLKTQAPF